MLKRNTFCFLSTIYICSSLAHYCIILIVIWVCGTVVFRIILGAAEGKYLWTRMQFYAYFIVFVNNFIHYLLLISFDEAFYFFPINFSF